MNRLILASAATLLLAAFLPPPVLGQSVSTDPVGFTTVAVPANRVTALALSLDDMPAYAAAASSVGSNTIQTANAGWASNAFGPFSSKPHVVRMMTGANKGRQFNIASHTADTLTLLAVTNLNTLIAPGDQYRIFASATLASLFGATAPGMNTNEDPELADNILIRGTSAWLTYYNDGTQWRRQGPGTVSNNAALLPEQGFLFVRRNNATSFTAVGTVPTTNLKSDLPGGRVVFLGNRFPVNTTLVALGLDQLSGWKKDADPELADTVLIRGSSAWLTYYHDGTSWIRQGPQSPNQNPTIPSGQSVLVVRRGDTSITLDQPRPYSLD